MKKELLTQEHLKGILHYCPDTGIFTWIKYRQGVKVGQEAGNFDKDYYRIITISSKKYKAHRLAFLYMNGEFPPEQVDHINRIKADNRWENLRSATNSQNQINSRKCQDTSSGFRGVTWRKGNQKWVARIFLNGKEHYLGLYDIPAEAHAAYCQAADELHGEFKNYG